MSSLSLSLFQNVIDLSDPKARDQFLATQFEMANQKMMEGKGYITTNARLNKAQFQIFLWKFHVWSPIVIAVGELVI